MMIAFVIILLSLVLLCIVISSAQVNQQNYLIGIKYISYNIPNGTIATGQCCDEPGKNGSCTPNLCDTAFQLCGTRNPTTPCDIFRNQMTPITYNTNLINFGKQIGNGVNTSSSLLVFKFPYQKALIDFNITALEMPDVNKTDAEVAIGTFNFIVNWCDPRFIKPPLYRRFVLNNTRMQFVVDIVSMCSRYYYTHNCAVYCKPNKKHYTCLNNGTKLCLQGWHGPNCMQLISYCPGNNCQHGSKCVPILLNYTCACPPNFAGYYCEIRTGTASSLITTPLAKTTTNPLTTPLAKTTTNPPTPSTKLTNQAGTFATMTTLTSVTVQAAGTSSSTSGTSKSVRTDQSKDSKVKDLQMAAGMAGGFLFLILLLACIMYAVFRKCNREKEKVEPEIISLPIYAGPVFNYVKTGKRQFT